MDEEKLMENINLFVEGIEIELKLIFQYLFEINEVQAEEYRKNFKIIMDLVNPINKGV